jgi:F-type H+-transporting ATPase subunit gamma
MATLREVRSRISGVKQTQKITKAMKMVAAAKLRRAQSSVVAARPYARGMRGLLQHLLPTVEPGSEPLLAVRPLRRLGVIVVTSDRGLCGAFNANIIRATTAHLASVMPGPAGEDGVRLFCVGKKGLDFFVKQALPVPGKYAGLFNHLTVAAAQTVVRQVVEMYLDGELDRVDVVYNEFKSIAQQRLVVEQILPVVPDATPAGDGHTGADPNYIYEPGQHAIVTALLPRYLQFSIWRVLLESYASEQGARMTAMEAATENANEMIQVLQLQYNKARQTTITKELLEIVSGAEALKTAD